MTRCDIKQARFAEGTKHCPGPEGYFFFSRFSFLSSLCFLFLFSGLLPPSLHRRMLALSPTRVAQCCCAGTWNIRVAWVCALDVCSA